MNEVEQKHMLPSISILTPTETVSDSFSQCCSALGDLIFN